MSALPCTQQLRAGIGKWKPKDLLEGNEHRRVPVVRDIETGSHCSVARVKSRVTAAIESRNVRFTEAPSCL
jgi:hypothetical protein